MIKDNATKKMLNVLHAFGFHSLLKYIYSHFTHKTDAFFIDSTLNFFKEKIKESNSKSLTKPINPIPHQIFVFWWTGFENAPINVKVCLDSIRAFNKGYNIVTISKNNIKDFIPESNIVFQRLIKKEITIQNFTDYLRMFLIYNYGGFWLDSTILFTKEFDLFKIFNNYSSFGSLRFSYSEKYMVYKNFHCTWSGFFIGGAKNSRIPYIFISCFEYYYSKKTHPYSYFMIDYLLFAIMMFGSDNDSLEEIPMIQGDMLSLDKNNYDLYFLKENYHFLLPQKTDWRKKWTKETIDYILKEVIKRGN